MIIVALAAGPVQLLLYPVCQVHLEGKQTIGLLEHGSVVANDLSQHVHTHTTQT